MNKGFIYKLKTSKGEYYYFVSSTKSRKNKTDVKKIFDLIVAKHNMQEELIANEKMLADKINKSLDMIKKDMYLCELHDYDYDYGIGTLYGMRYVDKSLVVTL